MLYLAAGIILISVWWLRRDALGLSSRARLAVLVALLFAHLAAGELNYRIGLNSESDLIFYFSSASAPRVQEPDILLPLLISTELIVEIFRFLRFTLGASFREIVLLFALTGAVGHLLLVELVSHLIRQSRSRFATILLYVTALSPTMILWTSGLPKDSLSALLLCGFLSLISRKTLPLIATALTIVSLAFVRPHVTVVLLVSAGLAGLIHSVVWLSRGQARLSAIIGLFLSLWASSVIASRILAPLLRLDTLASAAVFPRLAQQQNALSIGASALPPVDLNSPRSFVRNLPVMAMTATVRPFPWEAWSGKSLMLALEGSLLLTLIVLARTPLLRFLAESLHNFRVTLVATSAFGLLVLNAIGASNLGVVARTRAMLIPFLFVSMAIGVAVQRASDNHQTNP